MTKVILRHREARAGEIGLFPVDTRGAEVLHRLKINREVKVDVRFTRNTRELRLFWALVDFIAEHCPLFEGRVKDDIADVLKVATGLVVRLVDLKTGQPTEVVKSIAEDNLEQDRFDEFFHRACDIIATRWMPEGSVPDAIRKEVLAMIDGPGAIGTRVA